MSAQQTDQPRDHSMFDAELSGQIFNLALLGRLMRWLKPYRVTLLASSALILLASGLQVLLPVVISLVVVDHIIIGEASSLSPDLGMVALNESLAAWLNVHPLFAAALLYAVLQLGWAFSGHYHRLLLSSAVVGALKDLRHDLFAHLETRPASFYDRVQVGRVMTRVTNDVEALYELLRGIGALVGEFVPFFVALAIMFAVDVELTLILLLALPIMGTVTFYFRRATRSLFRLVRMSVSALNQNLQENLAGLTVVQLSQRERHNLDTYTAINEENRDHELRSMRLETFYGAFNDSMASIAIGVVIWFR